MSRRSKKKASRENIHATRIVSAASQGHGVSEPYPANSREADQKTDSIAWSVQSILQQDWFLALLLVVATVLAYQPVWHAGFIWDDDTHLTQNPCIVGPLGFKEIWTSSESYFFPLVLSSLWVQHALWGLNPLLYHLVNVAVHAACGVLLWRVLRHLNVRGAWLGAALWVLHPAMVQSVAWITELKNTQSCFFYLLAILFFLKWRKQGVSADGRRNTGCYLLALFCAILAILSKSSTVILPVVLGLCWWWMDGRWHWRNAKWLVPFLLVSILWSGWTIWEEKFHAGSRGSDWTHSMPERLIIAGKVVWFYLGKLAWPHPLVFVYPRWKMDTLEVAAYLPTLTATAGLFVLWRYRNGWVRPFFFTLAYFVTSLLPVLGFFDWYFLRYTNVGDHYQYLASMGPITLVAVGIIKALDMIDEGKPFLKPVFCGALLALLGVLTWCQSAMYADIETLWRTTIARNPDCWMAYHNLGNILLKNGQKEAAVSLYQKTLKINPDYAEAHTSLGVTLVEDGRVEEAAAHFQRALEINPDYVQAHCDLGNILRREGKVNEAIAHYQKALKISPRSAEVHYNLGNALLQIGRVGEAISEYQKTLEINPTDASAHNNLGNAFLQTGRVEDAIAQYRKTLVIDPSQAEAHHNLGAALIGKGQPEEAILEFQRALEIKPNFSEAWRNLGSALLKTGQMEKAVVDFQRALEIQPNNAGALHDLSWLLATCPEASSRNGTKAVELALQANQLTGNENPAILRTLAAAYTEAGRFPDAIKTARRALEFATAQGDSALAESLRSELALYEAGKPFHGKSSGPPH
jgi:protein O-mannosyl-transferase